MKNSNQDTTNPYHRLLIFALKKNLVDFVQFQPIKTSLNCHKSNYYPSFTTKTNKKTKGDSMFCHRYSKYLHIILHFLWNVIK